MISTQQSDFIEDMGSWDDGRWSWKFTWRRNFFVWEKELVESLHLSVDQTSLSESGRDVRVWTFDISNAFSVSGFLAQVNHFM